MTTLRMLRDRQGYWGFCCTGHSGYAESGEDIVCAAISALTQFCVKFAEMQKIGHILTAREEEAVLECRSTAFTQSFSDLLAVLEASAADLQQQFPEYIQLEMMEV